MLHRIIKFFLENKLVAFVLLFLVCIWGFYHSPYTLGASFFPKDPIKVDAIPDIGENQQILYTEWKGQSPQEIENQITYPWSPQDEDVKYQRNNQYGFINYTSALAADQVAVLGPGQKTMYHQTVQRLGRKISKVLFMLKLAIAPDQKRRTVALSGELLRLRKDILRERAGGPNRQVLRVRTALNNLDRIVSGKASPRSPAALAQLFEPRAISGLVLRRVARRRAGRQDFLCGGPGRWHGAPDHDDPTGGDRIAEHTEPADQAGEGHQTPYAQARDELAVQIAGQKGIYIYIFMLFWLFSFWFLLCFKMKNSIFILFFFFI
mgnify:CR=1 FL=1